MIKFQRNSLVIFCGEKGDSCRQNNRICVLICRNLKRRICTNLDKDRERVDRKKRYEGSCFDTNTYFPEFATFFNFLYPTSTKQIISPINAFLPSKAAQFINSFHFYWELRGILHQGHPTLRAGYSALFTLKISIEIPY